MLAQALWESPELAQALELRARRGGRAAGRLARRAHRRAVAWRRCAGSYDDGPHPHEARYLKLDSSLRPRAPRLAAALVGLDRGAREDRRAGTGALRDGRRHARRSRSSRSRRFTIPLPRRHDASRLPLLRRAARGTCSPTSACRRWPTPTCRPSSANAMEPFYPLHAYVCEQLLPGAARGVRDRPRRSSPTTPTSRPTPPAGSSTPPLRRADDRALRPRTRPARWSRSPATTATCCSTSTSAASRCSASSRPPTSPRWRSQKGIPTLVEFFGARDRALRWRPSPPADLLLGNNVLAHVPDLNDFVAGMKILLKPGGVITMEFPHLLRLIEREPVRHDLPRALLLLLLPDRRARVRGARPAAVRRRGAADPRRLAAHLRRHAEDADKPETRRRARSCASASAPPARAARDLPRLRPRRSRRTSARSSSFLIDLQGARASASPATARRRRATRCSTTAASAATSSTTRAIATRTSRAASCPAATSRSARPSAMREDAPDVVLILPWNLQGRDRAAAELHPRVGRALRGSHAGADAALRDASPDAACRRVWSIELERLGDERGCFARTFDAEEFRAPRPESRGRPVQRLLQRARRHPARHALPGRAARRGEARALRARGDLRRGRGPAPGLADASRWHGVELSAENGRSLYIPAGFAHGFQTLTDDSEVLYQMGHPYVPEAARGVRWDDPAFAIEWPRRRAGTW